MRRLANTLIPALIAGLAFACRPLASPGGAPAGPRASIGAPAQGSTLPFGPVEIVLHASNRAGVAQLELWIDGAVYARLPSPDPRLRQVTMRQTWEPTLAGTYLLQVRARDPGGTWGPYASAQVTIREREMTATPAPTPTATPTATSPPTGTPAPTLTRTRPAGSTRAPGPTETPIVIGAPSATPVPAARGPTISGARVSTTRFFYGGSSCGPQQMTVSVEVSDPSGVASVRINFFLADKASRSLTQMASLEMVRGDRGWSRTIDPATDIPGYNSYREAWFQFHFVATNSQGVQTRSPGYWTGFTLSRCGG